MNRIGVGIVGNGMATRVFHAPLIASVPQLELRGIVSRRLNGESPAPGVSLVGSLDELLADPAIRLVVIATPSATHAELADQALRAGRHVVVEKPLSVALEDAERLAAIARARKLHLAAFHNRRWDSDFLTVRAAVDEGLIGRVVHFESHFDRFRPEVRERWREDGSAGSGVWYDLGPHLIDQALVLFGLPEAVSADLAPLRPNAMADDWAHAVLRYPDKRVILHAGMCVAGGSPRFLAHGTGGSLTKAALDPQEAQSVAGLRPHDPEWGIDPDPLVYWDAQGSEHVRPALPGAQQTFYTLMARACAGEGPPPVTAEDALAVQRVLDAAVVSSREGRVVRIAHQP